MKTRDFLIKMCNSEVAEKTVVGEVGDLALTHSNIHQCRGIGIPKGRCMETVGDLCHSCIQEENTINQYSRYVSVGDLCAGK